MPLFPDWWVRVCSCVQQLPTSSSMAMRIRVSWPTRCDSSGVKTKSWRSSSTWGLEVKHTVSHKLIWTYNQEHKLVFSVSGQIEIEASYYIVIYISLSTTHISLTRKHFYFPQTSKRRTRSCGRLWPGGQPNWSRAGRTVKLWGRKTADYRRGWSSAAKKTLSWRIHCTTARRSCTGTNTHTNVIPWLLLSSMQPETTQSC